MCCNSEILSRLCSGISAAGIEHHGNSLSSLLAVRDAVGVAPSRASSIKIEPDGSWSTARLGGLQSELLKRKYSREPTLAGEEALSLGRSCASF